MDGHRARARCTAGRAAAGTPVLVIPDPHRPTPGMFRFFANGPALVRFADGVSGFCLSRPDGLCGERHDLVSAFFGDLSDWIGARNNGDAVQARRDIYQVLDEEMRDLAQAGLVVAARERFVLLTGGIDPAPLSWRIIDIDVRPADRRRRTA